MAAKAGERSPSNPSVGRTLTFAPNIENPAPGGRETIRAVNPPKCNEESR